MKKAAYLNGVHKSGDRLRGCYKADLYYKGHHVKEATFFPAHYSREKVLDSIFEAYEYCKDNGIPPVWKSDGKGILEGDLQGGY